MTLVVIYEKVKFKVKVQGENRRTAIVRPSFKIIFTKFGNTTEVILARNMTSYKIQNGGLVEVCTLCVHSSYVFLDLLVFAVNVCIIIYYHIYYIIVSLVCDSSMESRTYCLVERTGHRFL